MCQLLWMQQEKIYSTGQRQTINKWEKICQVRISTMKQNKPG